MQPFVVLSTSEAEVSFLTCSRYGTGATQPRCLMRKRNAVTYRAACGIGFVRHESDDFGEMAAIQLEKRLPILRGPILRPQCRSDSGSDENLDDRRRPRPQPRIVKSFNATMNIVDDVRVPIRSV